jgi:hypothetical protein
LKVGGCVSKPDVFLYRLICDPSAKPRLLIAANGDVVCGILHRSRIGRYRRFFLFHRSRNSVLFSRTYLDVTVFKGADVELDDWIEVALGEAT